MNMKDDLGDRMKGNYEDRTRFSLPRRTYTIIRVDGKAFHTYTKRFEKPFDISLMEAMDNTAQFLCEEIQGAKFAYVQSDEISVLVTDFETPTTDAWFDGNIQKMVSVSAAAATVRFNAYFADYYHYRNPSGSGFKPEQWAMFDSRVFTIPDRVEVANYFIWRQKDAERNSVQMAARALYSHKELNGKKMAELHEMLHAKGVNWAKYSDREKRGGIASRSGFEGAFSFTKERDRLITMIPSQWPEEELALSVEESAALMEIVKQPGRKIPALARLLARK